MPMLIDVRERHDHQITRNNISLRLAILLEREGWLINEEEKEKCQKWKGVNCGVLPIL